MGQGQATPPNGGKKTGETRFRDAVRAYRVAARVPLRDLSKEIGKSIAYISEMENGKIPVPDRQTVQAFAKALNLSDVQARDLEILATIGRQTVEFFVEERTEETEAMIAFVNIWHELDIQTREEFSELFKKQVKLREERIIAQMSEK